MGLSLGLGLKKKICVFFLLAKCFFSARLDFGLLVLSGKIKFSLSTNKTSRVGQKKKTLDEEKKMHGVFGRRQQRNLPAPTYHLRKSKGGRKSRGKEEEEEEEEEQEEEEEEEQEEEEKEEQQEQEKEPEQQQDTPEPDPPSSDQSASIPSLPDNTQETNLLDYFEEALALTEMEAFDNIIQDTPNLLEELPAILRSRTPDTSEVIVGDYETNDPTPPIVIDEIAEIVEEAGESVEVPDSPLPPLAGIGIPEPGVFGLFIVAAWFCTGWSFRRRRDNC